jgi:hypothetical protein
MGKLLAICTVALVALTMNSVTHALTTTNWVEYSFNPVYTDENGKAYYPTIIEEGGVYKMWYASQMDIRMTSSSDGINWTAPAVCTGLTNPNHPLVKKIGDTYRIWYWDTSAQPVPYTINSIRTATSADGENWQNNQPITQVGTTVVTGKPGDWNGGSYGPGYVIYNPSGSGTITEPVNEETVWVNKFVFYYMATTGQSESVGLAVSNDGVNWQGYNGGIAPVLEGTWNESDWDRTYVGYPTVMKENDDVYHMWYCGGFWNGDSGVGHGIGYAFSQDGINWTRDPANPIFHMNDGVDWRDIRTYTPVVIDNQMWFSGKNANTYAIGYATACTPVSLSSLSVDQPVVPLGNIVNFEAIIANGCGEVDALWDFDDGTYESQTNVTNPVTATKTYASAGVYTVVFSATDDEHSVGDNIMVVVYDPTGGFVTGGGWIDSPQGAYTPEPSLTGKAHFGFVAKYDKKTKLPVGNTEFVFKAGNINFHSSSYQWLIVNKNESRAQFKGAGTINGEGDYKFMLRAGDVEPDTFWIQIWEEDEVNGDEWVIYDNGEDQMISGGSIVVHAN